MPRVEIDEAELANLRTLNSVVDKISKHPKGGLLLEEAHKLVNPEARTPRLDQIKETSAPIENLQKTIDELKKSLADEKAKNEQDAKLTALQQKIDSGNAQLLAQGWTADGIKMLDEFRQKENILDPLAAAAYYEKLHGPQVQTAVPSSHFGRWDFTESQPGQQENDYTKKLLETKGDSESLVMNEAMKSINEFRGQLPLSKRS